MSKAFSSPRSLVYTGEAWRTQTVVVAMTVPRPPMECEEIQSDRGLFRAGPAFFESPGNLAHRAWAMG
jgi:hypothetical protein